MGAPLCVADDVEAILGRDPGAHVDRLIQLATGLIETEVDTSWDTTEDVPLAVVAIAARVVARTIANPEAVTRQETGPFASAWEPGSTLRLTDRDKADLGAAMRSLDRSATPRYRCGTTGLGGNWAK